MSQRKSLKMKIKGIEWAFFLQTQKAYIRKHGSDSEGIIYPEKREVYFNQSRLIPRIVRHELFHCYVESSGVYCSNLNAHQIEELGAVIVSEHGMELFLQSDMIIDYFTAA